MGATTEFPALFLDESDEDDEEEEEEDDDDDEDEDDEEEEEEDPELELEPRGPPLPESLLLFPSTQAHCVIALNPLPVGSAVPVIRWRAPFGVSGNVEVAFQVLEIGGQFEGSKSFWYPPSPEGFLVFENSDLRLS